MSFIGIFTDIENNGKQQYQCQISNQLIPEIITEITGSIEAGKTLKDVEEVMFWKCEISSLTGIFPNIKSLLISDCGLKKVKSEDLADYKQLRKITFIINQIEYLPGDLFEGFKQLEVIFVYDDNLKFIEPNILDGLKKLKMVRFKNDTYKKYYSKLDEDNSSSTLRQVKDELKQVFCNNLQDYKEYIREEFEAEPQQNLFKDVKKLSQNDSYKDIIVKIRGRDYNVHKFILASRSPILAEIIKNRPNYKYVNIFDMPIDIFEIILKYMYTSELPKRNKYDHLSLFAASGRLEIEDLKNHAGKHAMCKVDENNALEVLKLSNKYNHDELRRTAFEVIKKSFPKINFDKNLVKEPVKVESIVNNYKEAMKLAENAFNRSLTK